MNNYKIFGSIIFPKYNDHLEKRIFDINIDFIEVKDECKKIIKEIQESFRISS